MSDPLKNRQHALDELIDTEIKYIKDLKFIINDYYKEMSSPTKIPIPDNLKNKTKFIFMNILGILEWHEKFIVYLEKCIKNPIEFGPTFEKIHRKFEIYATFHHFKYLSDLLISENRDYFEKLRVQFGHDLFEVSDYLFLEYVFIIIR